MAKKQTKAKRRTTIIKLAREEHQRDGDCEIDDDAKVSEGEDNGCYIQAWVWVDFDGTPLDKEKADGNPVQG